MINLTDESRKTFGLLRDEQIMIRDLVRRIVKDKIAPNASEIDKNEDFPTKSYEAFRDNGILKLSLPKEYGGADADITTLCSVIEEISKVSPASALLVFATSTVIRIINMVANDEQKKRFFSVLEKGDKLCAIAITEPDYGSDAAGMQTKATLKDNKYILQGRKIFITNCGVSRYYLIFATVNPKLKKKGISVFIVEKDTPGFSIGKIEDKMGLRGSKTGEIIFEDAEIPQDNLIGIEGNGWKILTEVGNTMRLWGAASMSLGIAEGAHQYSLNYAKQRTQFGKPIAEHQAISFLLADMKIQIEAARSLIYRTAYLIDSGAKDKREIETLVSSSKCFSSDIAMKVTTDAVQVLGGYGYTKDYPVERMMRDAKALQILDGTNQIQRLVVTKNILQ